VRVYVEKRNYNFHEIASLVNRTLSNWRTEPIDCTCPEVKIWKTKKTSQRENMWRSCCFVTQLYIPALIPSDGSRGAGDKAGRSCLHIDSLTVTASVQPRGKRAGLDSTARVPIACYERYGGSRPARTRGRRKMQHRCRHRAPTRLRYLRSYARARDSSSSKCLTLRPRPPLR
jgi:hypothetical protein